MLAAAQSGMNRPSEREPDAASMLRVDQAGEYGATRIYAGQLAVMGDRPPLARHRAAWPSRRNATSSASMH